MGGMIFSFLAFDNDVVNIYLDNISSYISVYFIDESLICSPCIIEAKWHDSKIVQVVLGDESYFLMVFFLKSYLIGPNIPIYKW